jgi:hypothetical protein
LLVFSRRGAHLHCAVTFGGHLKNIDLDQSASLALWSKYGNGKIKA